MNIAIVISISSYIEKDNNLPACDADGSAMHHLLINSKKYDDILNLSGNISSAHLKKNIVDFINKHKKSKIVEVFFYYSGHGRLLDSEFYFIPSDFDPKRQKQTSLENTELDSLLRSISPELTIKIVDACQSGIQYVKDPNALKSYLDTTQGGFKNCYFMFSSRADQYSYQDNDLSFFTRSIITSVFKHKETSIRYKDLIDFVVDDSAHDTEQTPTFVVQADFTEIFCRIDEPMREGLRNFISDANTESATLPSKNTNLLSMVEHDASRYRSKDQIIEILERFHEAILSADHSDESRQIFDFEIEAGKYKRSIPDPRAIGIWIEKFGDDFFAETEKEIRTVSRRIPRRSPINLNLMPVLFDEDDDGIYKTIEEDRLFTTGFHSTVDLPYACVRLIATAKYPNLDGGICFMVPIVSKTHLQLFTSFSRIKEVAWDQFSMKEDAEWSSINLEFAQEEKISGEARSIWNRFESFLLDPILEKFGLSNNGTTETDTESQTSDETGISDVRV